MKTGIGLITEERNRQVNEEGWSSDHDDNHDDESLALAAACYAAPIKLFTKNGYLSFIDPWPWGREDDKRETHNRLKCLVIAGALIAAEIDRLQRSSDIGAPNLTK